MKIGLIVPGFSSDADDWCIPVLVDVIRELSRRADVHVFALRYPYREDHYHVHGAEVHALGGGEVRGLGRPRLLTRACARVLAEHRRGSFAVLHGLWADEPGFVAVAASGLLRIPAMVSVMGGELLSMADIGYGGQLAVSNRLLAREALARASLVTAGSTQSIDAARRVMRPSRHARITALTWGIDPLLFECGEPPLHLAGDIRVLNVGSLVPIKDHATLIRSIARLKQAGTRVHLHLVGDGPLRETLAERARALGLESSVTFHGHVPRHELAPYYRAAHVVAVSSRYEAQLVVALEAALCGTPIAGTAVGLVADFAPNAAIAVAVGDDCRLAEGIQATCQPETAQALAREADRLVRSAYLAAQTAEKLMALYHNAVAARGIA